MRLDQLTVQVAAEDVERPKSWTRDTITPDRWLIPLPEACVAELDEVAATVRATPRPVDSLAPADFSLRACTASWPRAGEARDRHRPRGGGSVPGRAVRDAGEPRHRLAARGDTRAGRRAEGQRRPPLRRQGHRTGARLRRAPLGDQPGPALPHRRRLALEGARLRGSLLSRVGAGGRPEPLHEPRDRAPRAAPPPARSARAPLPPFEWDRQGEHAPDDVRVSRQPVFEYEAGSWPRATTRTTSQRPASSPAPRSTTRAREALEAMRAIVDDPASWVEFRIEKGQLQYLNNRQFAHSRTAFKNAGAPQQSGGRHMLRLWNRDEGSWHLEGRPAA